MDPILENLGLDGGNLTSYQRQARRPYINDAGQAVVAIPTGRLHPESGLEVLQEQPIADQLAAYSSTLRRGDWERIDARLLQAAQERLTIYGALSARGLTFNAGGLGSVVSQWENVSEMTDAEITMDGETSNDRDRIEFDMQGVPIPMIHKDWKLSIRSLEASRTSGQSLDVTTGTAAARSVTRTIERMLLTGANVNAANREGTSFTLPGLTNWASRKTKTLSDWSNGTVTPETIYTEIEEMITTMEQQRCYGPFILFVPNTALYRFREDYKADSDRTLMDRVMATGKISEIVVSDSLDSNDVIMLEPTDQFLDIAEAAGFSTVQWQSGSGFTLMFKSYMAAALRLKTDFDGHVGVMHGSW